MKKAIVITLIGILIISSLVSCTKKENVIKIGIIAPLTGDAAVYGKALKDGMVLAKDIINEKKGIDGRQLQLVFEDNQADPKIAISAYNKLTQIDKVTSIIGCMFSSTTLAIAPLAQKDGITLLSPTGSSEEIPAIGNFIFSIYPSDSYDGKFIAEYLLKQDQIKSIAILSTQADAMINVKSAFEDEIKSRGKKIVFQEIYSPKTENYKTILTKLNNSKPDIIFVSSYIEELAKILKQDNELGFDHKFITISTAYDRKLISLASNSAEGLIFSAPIYNENSSVEYIENFQEIFKTKYGDKPNIWAAYGYDAINIICEAYKISMNNNTKLNEELVKIQNFKATTGETSFLDNGSVSKEMQIYIIKDMNFTELKNK